MPWNAKVQMLFGQVEGYCTRHGFRSPEIEDADSHPKKDKYPPAKTSAHPLLHPPDLIIQDELHLISGPLGTLVALYETAVDRLCSWKVGGKTVRPKVIASTATIRKAGDQVHATFLREVRVFPPSGLDVEDNFFAIQRPSSDDTPRRRYAGICAPGRRLKVALIRAYVALLSADQFLYEKKGYCKDEDPWMTLIGYFNSMRELGGMRLIDRRVEPSPCARRLIDRSMGRSACARRLIERRIVEPPRALRTDRPKQPRMSLRASVGSTCDRPTQPTMSLRALLGPAGLSEGGSPADRRYEAQNWRSRVQSRGMKRLTDPPDCKTGA
jgi:hypothetical protein